MILPSGQRATISLSYEVPDPREALEPNGPFARVSLRAGASHGEVQGPAADLKESLAAMLRLLREHC